MAKRRARTEIFLNLPYDPNYEKLFLAYICALCAFGMIPRLTLEIPGGKRRLDRIFGLIRDCKYSVHDLSRVQLDRLKPRTPRFNMPFELGLVVAQAKTDRDRHVWFVMESMRYRLSKSLSDLNGTDPYIHDGTIEGVFREIGNAFARKKKQPTVAQMWRIYREVRKLIGGILKQTGAQSVFEASVYKQMSVVASTAASAIVK